jgi:hypothetical protein
MRKSLRLLALIASLSLTPCARLNADVVLYETGFEAPTFTAGLPLDGQGGWFALGGVSLPAATISDDVSNGGQQSVRMEGALMEDFGGFFGGFWIVSNAFDPLGSGLPRVDVTVDLLLVPAPGDPTSVLELSANVQVYDSLGQYLAGIYLAPDGTVSGDNFDFEFVETSVASLDVFHTLGIHLDYLAREVSFSVDGLPFGSVDLTGPGVDFGDADLSLSSRVPFVSQAFFDNYRITARAVPEPSGLSVILVGLGFLGLTSRYTRRTCRRAPSGRE